MRTVADVMTADVKTVQIDDVVGPIRDLMLDGELHGVPVLDHDGDLAGIVTASDLVEEWAPEQGVVTVMTDKVEKVLSATSLAEAARSMLRHRVHHLVVVADADDRQVVGIVSSFDLLQGLAETAEAAQSSTVSARTPAQPGDLVVIRGHKIGQPERRAIIIETRGSDGGPPYVVNWLDDPHSEPHDVLFFPGSDADIEQPDD